MNGKTLGAFGLCLGLLAILGAYDSSRRVESVEKTINDRVRRWSDGIDIPEAMIERAVDSAVAKSMDTHMSYATRGVISKFEREISSHVKTAVTSAYGELKESVATEMRRQVGRIDIDDIKDEVVEKAKDEAIEKLNDNLDSILDKFKLELNSMAKIHQSIADAFSGADRSGGVTFRIS